MQQREDGQRVLWAYRCTPQTTTQETLYSLTYDTEALIPVEVGESSIRRQLFELSLNQESLAVELDLINELHDKSKIRKATYNLRATRSDTNPTHIKMVQHEGSPKELPQRRPRLEDAK